MFWRDRQRMLGGGRINNPGQTLPLSFYLLHPGKHKLSEQMFWPPSIQALTGHTSWLHGHWSMVIPCNAGPACFGKLLINIVLISEDKDFNWNESILFKALAEHLKRHSGLLYKEKTYFFSDDNIANNSFLPIAIPVNYQFSLLLLQ